MLVRKLKYFIFFSRKENPQTESGTIEEQSLISSKSETTKRDNGATPLKRHETLFFPPTSSLSSSVETSTSSAILSTSSQFHSIESRHQEQEFIHQNSLTTLESKMQKSKKRYE